MSNSIPQEQDIRLQGSEVREHGVRSGSTAAKVLKLAELVKSATHITTRDLTSAEIDAMTDGTVVRAVIYGIASADGLRAEASLYDWDDIPDYRTFSWDTYKPRLTSEDDVVVVINAIICGDHIVWSHDPGFYCGHTIVVE